MANNAPRPTWSGGAVDQESSSRRGGSRGNGGCGGARDRGAARAARPAELVLPGQPDQMSSFIVTPKLADEGYVPPAFANLYEHSVPRYLSLV